MNAVQENKTVPQASCPICWGQRVIWELVAGTNQLLPMKCDECFGTGRHYLGEGEEVERKE